MPIKKGKSDKKEDKPSRYWLYFGLIVFLLAGLGAGIGTFDMKYFWDSLYGIVDWIAASIPYFFYGAVVGAILDLYINKKEKHYSKLPDWFNYTVLFIIFSIIAIWIILPAKFEDILFCLYFPFHYGVFFPGVSYTVIPFNIFPGTIVMKLALDIIFLGIFFRWLCLRVKSIKGKASEKEKRGDKVLIRLVFIILLIGMIKTATLLH